MKQYVLTSHQLHSFKIALEQLASSKVKEQRHASGTIHLWMEVQSKDVYFLTLDPIIFREKDCFVINAYGSGCASSHIVEIMERNCVCVGVSNGVGDFLRYMFSRVESVIPRKKSVVEQSKKRLRERFSELN